jgi:4-hydroxy-3-methylbut-2-enyl diphosphate reductase
MIIYLARHRGLCSGVKRSIRLAEKTLSDKPAPVYILNDIVHNQTVIEELKARGLIKVTDPNEVKSGTLIISAHGIPHDVITGAQKRGLDVVDTTCPLVYKIHKTAKTLREKGYEVILFGDPGHDEVKGIAAVDPEHIHVVNTLEDIDTLPEYNSSVAFISQSTKNVERFHLMAEKLLDKYGPIRIENTICQATRLRQEAIINLGKAAELVIVIGSKSSANSNRLVEIAESLGARAYLIDNADDLDLDWLDEVDKIGITAGASTPEHLVDEVLKSISDYAEEEDLHLEVITV